MNYEDECEKRAKFWQGVNAVMFWLLATWACFWIGLFMAGLILLLLHF